MIKRLLQKTLNTRVIKILTIKAFTLSEVLITLLIIGVVASITIPVIIKKASKAVNVAQLKKVQSSLEQAFMLVTMDHEGSILKCPNISSSTGSASDSANAMNEFATKMKVLKICGSGLGCLYASPLRFLGGDKWVNNLDTTMENSFGKAILADGTMMMIDLYNQKCTYQPDSAPAGSLLYHAVCGYIQIDTNGASGPNQYGRDYFGFWIAQTGIYPFGIYSDGTSCDINSSEYSSSIGCAGKVIAEGAMNY